jgi:hypothetical protein
MKKNEITDFLEDGASQAYPETSHAKFRRYPFILTKSAAEYKTLIYCS